MHTSRPSAATASLLGAVSVAALAAVPAHADRIALDSLAAPVQVLSNEQAEQTGLQSVADILRSANTLRDNGGGNLTGLQIRGLAPEMTGDLANTGLLGSTLRPVLPINVSPTGAFVSEVYGESNYRFTHTNFGGGDDDGYFGTGPDKFAGIGGAYHFGGVNDVFFGGRLALAFFKGAPGEPYDDFACGYSEDVDVCLYDLNMFVGSNNFGKLTVGLGETAYDDIAGISLGGIRYATGYDLTEKDPRFEGDFPNFAGVGRNTGVRYDSPTLAGFNLSASWGDADFVGGRSFDAPGDVEQSWDVALRYAGEFGAIRTAAGVGYQNTTMDFGGPTGEVRQDNFGASASVLHTPTGLFAAGSYAYVHRSSEFDPKGDQTDTASLWYAQAGIRQNWTGYGDTTLYGEYGYADNSRSFSEYFNDDSSTQFYGLGVAQDIDAAATSLYLTYTRTRVDFGGSDDSFNTFTAGVRVKW